MLTHSLRVMSKWVEGYSDFKHIEVDDNGERISFMEYIKRYGRPSEQVYIPETDQLVPLYGFMAVLAAASSLSDMY
jgi:hypothetical protein